MKDKSPKENKLELLSLISILLSITVLFIGSIFVVYGLTTLREFSKTMIFISIIQLILYIINKIKNPKFSKLEIILYILFILSGLSLIGTNNLDISIWGYTNRYEGLLMIYAYYIICLITSTLKDKLYKEFIINCILFIGLINFIYALFQTNILTTNIIDIKQPWKYARGFQGNSMYYSALICICYFISLGKYLYTNKKYSLILIFIFTIASFISGSMGLLCTIILLLIIIIIITIIKKENIKKLIICISIFLIIGTIYMINEKHYNKDVKELSSELSSVIKDNKIEDSFGTGRIYIWKNVIEKSKEHPLFGVGIDNLYNSFTPKLIDKKSNLPVDKAHNEYLQKIVCEGIISGLLYITFLILVFVTNIKTKDETKKIMLLAFIAYAIQAFFNISVIRITPLFFIIIGLLINNSQKDEHQ